MKKRILIDASTVISKIDGLSQYIINLIKHLPEESFDIFDYSVLVNKDLNRNALTDILKDQRFTIIEARIAPIGPKREWDMFWFLRKYKTKFDLFHSTSNQYPLYLKKGIATIHDITFRKYLNAPWYTFKTASFFLNLVIKNSLYRSVAVIAVSEFTKNDLVNKYQLNEKIQKKISVIYEGWEHLINSDDNEIVNTELFEFENYLFYVGTTRVHKNMKNLLKAFIIAANEINENISLVIVGNESYLDDDDKKSINAINEKYKRVFFTGFVSKKELDYLFTNCCAFIFPSLSEGFGIPVLEAFYFKKPLLCSNSTSLPEIAGNAALYFDPSNPEDIARSVITLYKDPAIGPGLVKKGEERLQLFSWKKTASQTVQLYMDELSK